MCTAIHTNQRTHTHTHTHAAPLAGRTRAPAQNLSFPSSPNKSCWIINLFPGFPTKKTFSQVSAQIREEEKTGFKEHFIFLRWLQTLARVVRMHLFHVWLRPMLEPESVNFIRDSIDTKPAMVHLNPLLWLQFYREGVQRIHLKSWATRSPGPPKLPFLISFLNLLVLHKGSSRALYMKRAWKQSFDL